MLPGTRVGVWVCWARWMGSRTLPLLRIRVGGRREDRGSGLQEWEAQLLQSARAQLSAATRHVGTATANRGCIRIVAEANHVGHNHLSMKTEQLGNLCDGICQEVCYCSTFFSV